MSNSVDAVANKSALRKKFLHYLFPSVIAMWVYSIYTMVDGMFVGRGVGPTALAAVNIAMPYVNFVFACSMFFSTGASTIISISLGKNNNKDANEIFTLNLVAMIVFSLTISILSYINIDKLALFLGATENTLPFVISYLKIIIVFNTFFIVSYCLEVLTKTDGYPYLAIIGVVLSAITNIVLDYLFVIKLNRGVEGAAVATGISQVISTIFFFSHFCRKVSKLKLTKFKFKFNTIKRIIFIGFPDAITELTSGVVILLFNQSILKYIGENGIVSYSVICYVSTLVLMTMIGITQGMQPLSSFYFGKEDNTSIKQLLKMSFKAITFASILIFTISIIFTNEIVSIFISKENLELFSYSVKSFRIYSFSFLILGYNILISGFSSSIEKPVYATIISLSRGLILVSIVLLVMITMFGGSGIWFTTIISEGLCVIISFFVIKKSLIYINSNEPDDSLEIDCF
ncbi:MATE family efflux transporter [Clostridium senegalense]|uniref:MATE family efflux transporter n=1 Tax=Clostridium senegalense TaxID=1465809 RepID=UPI00028888AF|nr:MATE family efflux transporter [Clostridium senegalense]